MTLVFRHVSMHAVGVCLSCFLAAVMQVDSDCDTGIPIFFISFFFTTIVSSGDSRIICRETVLQQSECIVSLYDSCCQMNAILKIFGGYF